MVQADCSVQYFSSESRGQAYLFWTSYLLEYVSDVDDLYVEYDRCDYLNQPQSSFVLLVNVNIQSYTKTK